MTVPHPAFATAAIISDRIAAVIGGTGRVSVEELSIQQLKKKAQGSELTWIVVSPEETTRAVSSRRRVRTGSASFSIAISVSKHTGDVGTGDRTAGAAFFDSVQSVIDAAMGIDDTHPDGQSITLPAPWGPVTWPEEISELPTDEDLSAMSVRSRTALFTFQVTRGA